MKDPLRVPLESAEPELAGPRLVHEAGDGDPNPVPSVCIELHEARLRGGYNLADAAKVLRIQQQYLQALEEGRFDQIPGTAYTIGFLRSYAGFLGLDPDEIVGAFKRERSLDTGEQRLSFPSPTRDSPKPKLWLVLLVLVLAGLAYGGWQYQSTDGQIATDLVADVSTRLTEAVGLDAADTPPGEAAETATGAVAPESEPRATEPAAPADSIPAETAAVEPTAVEPTAVEPIAAEPIPVEPIAAEPIPVEPIAAEPIPVEPTTVEPTAAASREAESAAAEPIVTAAAEPDPVPATSAPDQAAPEAATGDIAAAAPAAENWDETAALPEAGNQTGTSAVPEAGTPPAENEPVAPPPAKIEAAAETVSTTPAAVDPAEPLRSDEMAAPAEPAVLSAPAYPAEPVDSGAETDSQRQVITAPLELASATVGATASGEPDGDIAAAQGAPPEPTVDAAPDETSTVAAVNEAETLSLSDSGYVPKVYGRSNLDARVVITAVDDSWVQIQGPDNELLLTRILHTGDSYRVPDRPGLVMVTGNAGGLEVRVDDASAPALGPLGVVLRNIALDPDRLLAGTATAR